MIFFLLGLSFFASADFAFQGKVLALKKNGLQGNFLVQIDSLSMELEVDRGPSYYCLKESLSSQQLVEFSFDPKNLKIRSCEKTQRTANNKNFENN